MFHVRITPTAEQMLRDIGNKDILATISAKIDDLRESPDQRGKALKGDLAGFRSIPAASRYRIVYRVTLTNPPPGDEGWTDIVGVGIRKQGDKRDIYRLVSRMVARGDV